MKLTPLNFPSLQNKTLLMRVDFNVPLTADLKVANDTRIQRALPTIKEALKENCKLVLISHLGRPKGTPNPDLSLQPVATYLQSLLDVKVDFHHDCIGEERDTKIASLKPGSVLVLENVRFHPEEKKNDREFARALTKNSDIYINEAFSAAHRAHASTVGVTEFLPSFAGPAFTAEVEHLAELVTNPPRPFVMVVGGRKISDKIAAVQKLTDLADVVLVGGGVANNFLKADDYDVYSSYTEDAPADTSKENQDFVKVAHDMIEDTKNNRILIDGYIPLPKILYPTDVLVGDSVEDTQGEVIELINGDIKHPELSKKMFLDIGPKTSKLYRQVIQQAETIFWNGPMGVFENPTFAAGTEEVADAIANAPGRSILGGGDTIAAVEKFENPDRYDYISAAGGAALEFLSGKTLPGVEPLLEKTS